MIKNKPQKKKGPPRKKGSRFAHLAVYCVPSYSGQVVRRERIPGRTIKLTTIAGGVITPALTVLNVGAFNTGTPISGWTTKWENIYEEYFILGIDFEIIPISLSGSGGLIFFWWDEKNNAVASLADTQSRSVKRIQIPNTGQKTFRHSWTVRDVQDCVYSDVAVDTAPVFYKFYTDSAAFGSAPLQDIFVLQPFYHVQFRGFKA